MHEGVTDPVASVRLAGTARLRTCVRGAFGTALEGAVPSVPRTSGR